ncbi:MAG: hypothetical protein KAU60_11860 [Desulfobacterales bacterium]|nr:hypothetical protein [Desulfobacterales bacterium]
MQIKKDTKVKVTYRPELGTGAVLQVAEAPGGEYNVDVIFEKDGKRFLETFPQSLLTPVADIFQRAELAGRSSVYKLPADDGVLCGNNQSSPYRINRKTITKNTFSQR